MSLQQAPQGEMLISLEVVPELPEELPAPRHFQAIRGELVLVPMEILNSQLTRQPENQVRIRLNLYTIVQTVLHRGPVQIPDLNTIVLTDPIRPVIIIQG